MINFFMIRILFYIYENLYQKVNVQEILWKLWGTRKEYCLSVECLK